MNEPQERYHEYISRRFREIRLAQQLSQRNETIANVDVNATRITVLEEKVTQLELFVKSIKGPY